MKYVVNTVWSHPNDIDWDRMKEGLEQLRDDEGAADEVTWYEIDATTHGSVAVYSSQEKYEKYKSKLEEYRKDATDEIGAQIINEFQGLVKASI
ncbi:MAG: hypothetical protein ISQ79_03525 [Candidatus Actinomarina sp.]|nr:hypothetical protein [Candidatus Actinomarina sp.]|tara:strand:- start:324 stop:605 length:282 start_codon:yes stop_codon:yes gene_type:complete